MVTFAEAVSRLYQAPLEQFVAERKRLAAELTASGDKAAGKQLAKLGRPPLSAWAVNQLWWRERDSFERLLTTAKRLGAGDLDAARAHREVLAELRAHASAVLADAGHATADAVLRRVTTTLQAIAATGGFEPDLPGALPSDRDPPGFESLASFVESGATLTREPRSREAPPTPEDAPDEQRRAEEEDARLAEEARRREEERRLEEEKARKLAARRRLEARLATLRSELDAREQEISRLRQELQGQQEELEKTRAETDRLEAELAKLD